MDEEWRIRAACRGMDPNLWFPERAEEAGPAKAVCFECPVRQTCLDYAMSVPVLHGVWGGRTRGQRDFASRGRKTALGNANARKTHCKNNHEFTPENTYISSYNGQRVCRTCRRDVDRRYRLNRNPGVAS